MKTTKENFKKDNPAVFALAQTVLAKLLEPHKEVKEEQFWSLFLHYYDQTKSEIS